MSGGTGVFQESAKLPSQERKSNEPVRKTKQGDKTRETGRGQIMEVKECQAKESARDSEFLTLKC